MMTYEVDFAEVVIVAEDRKRVLLVALHEARVGCLLDRVCLVAVQHDDVRHATNLTNKHVRASPTFYMHTITKSWIFQTSS